MLALEDGKAELEKKSVELKRKLDVAEEEQYQNSTHELLY